MLLMIGVDDKFPGHWNERDARFLIPMVQEERSEHGLSRVY